MSPLNLQITRESEIPRLFLEASLKSQLTYEEATLFLFLNLLKSGTHSKFYKTQKRA